MVFLSVFLIAVHTPDKRNFHNNF